jgi:hypothetical protein
MLRIREEELQMPWYNQKSFIHTDIMPDIIPDNGPDYRYTDIIPNIIPDIIPDIVPDIGVIIAPDVIQDGLVPPLEKEAAGIISSSEAILKAYATKHPLNAKAINDLIKKIKNSAFNANEVDIDMLQRLQASIDSGDIQIIDMNVEGDDEQVLAQFRRPAEKVLPRRELMAGMRLAGCQHFAFHEYKDPRGNRLFCRALEWFGIFSISPSKGW